MHEYLIFSHFSFCLRFWLKAIWYHKMRIDWAFQKQYLIWNVYVGLDALCLLCASVYGYEKCFDLDYGSYSMFVHFCSKLRSHASSSKYTTFKVWNPLRQTTSCVTSILIQPPSLVLFPYSTSRVCNEETTFTITNIKNLKFSALTIDLLKTLHYVTVCVCVCVFKHYRCV